jgi:hypothetical protein
VPEVAVPDVAVPDVPVPLVPVPDVAVPDVPVPDVAVLLLPDETARMTTVLLPAAVGVPMSEPVDALMVRPEGKPVAEYVNV